ncbi:MAG: glyoxalase superfamily protein [Crocinitomicaceae bacterium]|nr:glyoxalase superfamily protein [Crocinitomicaceae bacterium]
MAKVIGIGGIFFKFKDPTKMRAWYADVLGMTTNPYGVLFEFNGGEQSRGYLQLGTFEETSDYFGTPEQRAMINYRVDNLVEFKKELEAAGVKIVDTLEEYSYGKFLHIQDPEGNRIELWEPAEKEFEEDGDAKMIMR